MTELDKRELNQRMNQFETVCRDAGIKLTHQRIEIFRELAKTYEHPNVEMVYRGVRKRMPTVSLDTVYRTLWLLNDLGLIKTLGMPQERTRFDANLRRHHHFVCRKCGLTRDVHSDEFDNLIPPDSVKVFGQVETTQVEIQGTCLKCIGQNKAARLKQERT